MIELTRSQPSAVPVVKVLGIGGAGGNLIDRLILDGFDPNQVAALNTDLQALNGSVAPEKVHLGQLTTRGLGTGGDPELGYVAAEEAMDEISGALAGADMVFLCAGLGGGTGSGAAPLISHLARKAGATVVALVTLPFGFEGKRRAAQAAEALAQLEQQANLVLCFENDAMGSVVAPTAGIQQAFVATDQTLSQTIRAVIGIVQRRGLVNIGLDDLSAALGRLRSGAGVRCLFGHGESDSSNRAHEALERALRNPLMDKGRMLAEAQQVLVHIAGGPDLTLNEVTILMEELNRHISEYTRVSFGVATDAKLGRRLAVSVLSAAASAIAPPKVSAVVPASMPVAVPPPVAPVEKAAVPKAEAHVPVEPLPDEQPAVVQDFFPEIADKAALDSVPPSNEEESAPAEAPVVRMTPPVAKRTPAATPASSTKAAATSTKKEERAQQMTLEPANRGRFEKSEPTIVDGEDLDVPTFLRKNVRR